LAIVIWPRSTHHPVPPPAITQQAIDTAAGKVTYCTGADSVVSKTDPTISQHKQAVANFDKLPGNHVEAKLVPFASDATDQYDQFSRDLQTDRTCDVFYSDVTWTADFAHNKWLADLSPYFADGSLPSLSGFVRAMQAAAVFDGKEYGVPKQADAGLLYYRKDKYRSVPATVQALYKEAAPGQLMRYQGEDYEGLTVNFLELAFAAGAMDLVTADHKANIDQQPEREALQLMVDAITSRAVPRAVIDQEEGNSTKAFTLGRADFMRNWSPVYAALQLDKQLAGRVGVAPLPPWTGRKPVSVLGGHVLVVAAHTQHLAAALKLVEYLTSQAVMKTDATEFSLAPARSDLWADPQVASALPAFPDLKNAIFSAVSRPVTPNYAAVSAAISNNVNSALRGQLTVAQALNKANYDMQRALDAVHPPGR
jgi:multiple sugar transport system substrate-binding protein